MKPLAHVLSLSSEVSQVPGVSDPDHKPRYICISGNSGTGKSTLLGPITEHLAATGPSIGIDEGAIHHPFLHRLFDAPHGYAYELQLNFMIQRVLVVKRWIDAGVSVAMERGHLDDLVFIRHLRRFGFVTRKEHDAYISVWHQLEPRVPRPDAIVFLDLPAEESLRRLTAAENDGSRPREFPDDVTKTSWITSWHELYRQRFAEVLADDDYKSITLRIRPEQTQAEILTLLQEMVK